MKTSLRQLIIGLALISFISVPIAAMAHSQAGIQTHAEYTQTPINKLKTLKSLAVKDDGAANMYWKRGGQ